MTATPVILAILDRVRKELDGYCTATVGFSDGSASTLRFSEAAARLLAEQPGRVLQRGTRATGQIAKTRAQAQFRLPYSARVSRNSK